jgi:hypothetical protein
MSDSAFGCQRSAVGQPAPQLRLFLPGQEQDQENGLSRLSRLS